MVEEDKGISELLEEYKVEAVEAAPVELELVGKEEIVKRGRHPLTEEEKTKRREENVKKIVGTTPYVGGTPSLADSGGWCLTESKTVTTVVDRRTGKKTIKINGLEVDTR